ncbi:MAG: ABC transporter permease [Sulfobacillus acidophilus]|uniref:Autoinducer 2 import system permease protein LsrC n=1 Tax=Sulfobacillus acidophilus TaxID=53633 RepID=A0A2T2WDB1_9FIRM|nr:MAG: ABC transporter permease [Sulfobacillus acidophilus]
MLGRNGSIRRPLLFLVIALIIATIIQPSFLTVRNLNALLISSTFLMIVAVGEAVVIMTGMIDLGVESTLSAGGMFVAFLNVFHQVPGPLSVAFGLAAGAIAGLVVGLLVTKGRIPSFLVTLATYWGFQGLALLLNGGNYISPYSVTPPRPFGFQGLSGSVFGISNLLIITIFVIAAAQVMVSYTPVGVWLKSIGSNEASARTVGLSTDRIKIMAFMISGILAVLAGIMMAAWQVSIYPNSGQGYSLQAIAGVILGGIPFTGGRGTIVGAAIGALIIGLINDIIVLMGWPALYEYVIVGVILVIAGLQARGQGVVK